MAKLLEYKGYYGSIEASPEDGCLFGKLEFINALLNYEAETVPALAAAFREAVDDYLADCARRGREPELPCKGSFNVRVGHDAHLRAAVAAKERGLSLNDFTRQAIEMFVQSSDGQPKPRRAGKPAKAQPLKRNSAKIKTTGTALPKKRRA
jgi:predicted HicB family RNase H-like nuclease